LLKISDFLSFGLIISSDETQSKVQFNTLSLGENKTDVYRPGNIFFPQMKTSRKVHICLHRFVFFPGNVLLCKAVPVRYQLFIIFILCYCL